MLLRIHMADVVFLTCVHKITVNLTRSFIVLFLLSLALFSQQAQPASSDSSPPSGSDEAKIAIGDAPIKVTQLLGQPVSFSHISPTRSVCVFKRCSIVFGADQGVRLLPDVTCY